MAEEQDLERFTTKKCPECFSYMPLRVRKCPICKCRVGPVNRFGLATRPVDVKSYIVFALAFVALVAFIWWAFLR